MEELLKYELPNNKYTVDEFMVVFRERSLKLYNNIDNLTVEEARIEFKKIFEDCPIELNINPFGLENTLKKKFPNFYDNTNSRVYNIDVGNIPDNEVELYIQNIRKNFLPSHD